MMAMTYRDLATDYSQCYVSQAHLIISSTFEALDVEPESHWQHVLSSNQHGRVPTLHTVVGVDNSSNVVSVCHIEYFARCRCALLVYWAVKKGVRGGGLGTAVFNAAITSLCTSYPDWCYLFAETHSVDADDDVMQPIKRQNKFHSLGFVQVPCRWYLPPLSRDVPPADNYVLVARPHYEHDDRECHENVLECSGQVSSIPASVISTFLDDFFKYSFPYVSPDVCHEPYTRAKAQFVGKTSLSIVPAPPWRVADV